MGFTAVVHIFDGDEAISTVGLEGAPLPREGEIVNLRDGPYRVQQVVHNDWTGDTVTASEIVLEVTPAPDYDG